MTPNDDIYETAELFSVKDVELYLKHDWILQDVKDRPFNPRDMDDTSCPVIYVVGRGKKDRPK
jgi:hypothetical protein